MDQQIFPVFIVVWIVLGLLAGAFFYLSKNARLKRRWWPAYTIGVSLFFLGFVALSKRDATSAAWYIVFPLVAVITYLNMRSVRFCDACGKTIQNALFIPMTRCPKCGAQLK